MDMTALDQVAEWMGGRLVAGDSKAAISRVNTDTRAIEPGDLFFALRGENFDGHAFAGEALRRGAAAVVVEKVAAAQAAAELRAGRPGAVIGVDDTLAALQALAGAYRRTLSVRVIGVTGSNGKTTTKDFVAAVASAGNRVLKTEGNLNNHIGVPLTVLRAGRDHEVAVVEMGMNHAGEIAPLAAIAAPEIGVITHVGMAHIEFLGSREAIAKEKGALAEALPERGALVIDGEGDFAGYLRGITKARVIETGFGKGDVRATDIRADRFGCRFVVEEAGGGRAEVRLPVPGEHIVRNALFAVAVGRLLGVSLGQAAERLAGASITGGRFALKDVRGVTFIDDTYNANPDSMLAALGTVAAMGGRRFAVLGQMNELGDQSEAGHAEVGASVAGMGFDGLATVGPVAAGISDAAKAAGMAAANNFGSVREAAEWLEGRVVPGDIVLVKGSRGARMERVIEAYAGAGATLAGAGRP